MLGFIRGRGVAVACVGAWLGTLALGSDAHAAVMTQTVSVTKALNIELPTHFFAMPKFNPALGTLTSVSAGLSGGPFTAETEPQTNQSGSTQSGKVTFTPRAFVNGNVFGGDGLYMQIDPGTPLVVPYNLAPNEGLERFTVNGDAFSFSTQPVTYSAVRAAFTGTGTHTAIGAMGVSSIFELDPGTSRPTPLFAPRVTGEMTLSITYTYTGVPEPASAGLITAAGAALCLRRRRVGAAAR